jgi:hypothetical protein
MLLTNRQRAKIVVTLKLEELTTIHNERDYTNYLGYLINKFLSPVLYRGVDFNGHIPNPKRKITIRARIVELWRNAMLQHTNDSDMYHIYESLMIRSQKRLSKSVKKVG